MQFSELNIIPEIKKALQDQEYKEPTPIQEQAIPAVLAGRDLLGCAQTGTGKTAAFAIPTLQILHEGNEYRNSRHPKIKALIITPTRELALQIYESFNTYGAYLPINSCVVFGGVSQKPQEDALKKGVDVLVATPGRLNDLINQKLVSLKNIEIFILDEADRMLDMGFIRDIKKIIAETPPKKQTLLFSATMPKEIEKISNSLLKNPMKIQIAPVSATADTVEQRLYFVDRVNKKNLLFQFLRENKEGSVLVFTRTKHGADRLVKQLAKEKLIAQAIHGDKSQGARQKALDNFKNNVVRVLIATDIAARGIDIDELAYVINYDLPNISETYVHRIGRTGRAGLGGIAISFCDFTEKEYLADIEKLIRKSIPVIEGHDFPMLDTTPLAKKVPSKGRRNSGQSEAKKTKMSTSGELKEKKPKGNFKKPGNYKQGKAKLGKYSK